MISRSTLTIEWGSGGQRFKSSHPDYRFEYKLPGPPNQFSVVLPWRRLITLLNEPVLHVINALSAYFQIVVSDLARLE